MNRWIDTNWLGTLGVLALEARVTSQRLGAEANANYVHRSKLGADDSGYGRRQLSDSATTLLASGQRSHRPGYRQIAKYTQRKELKDVDSEKLGRIGASTIEVGGCANANALARFAVRSPDADQEPRIPRCRRADSGYGYWRKRRGF